MICADSDYFLLELKPSIIPGAGLGVFAKADIDAGIILAEYRGAVFLSELESKINKLNNRCLSLNNDSFIAGTNCIASFSLNFPYKNFIFIFFYIIQKYIVQSHYVTSTLTL